MNCLINVALITIADPDQVPQNVMPDQGLYLLFK